MDAWLGRRRARRRGERELQPGWTLRLFQIQMTLVYVAAAWHKLRGDAWIDGTALYYVTGLEDLFGRFPVPEWLTSWTLATRWLTWAVIGVEAWMPIGLWVARWRRPTLVVGFLFHLTIDYAMNLFLFQWVMMAGLVAFVSADELRAGGCRVRGVLGATLRITPGLGVGARRRDVA